MREAGDHDRHHVGAEFGQVLKELQAVGARSEVPVEDGKVDGVLVGLDEGFLGIRRGENETAEVRAVQPFAEGLADRLLVIDDQDGVIGTGRQHGVRLLVRLPLGT